LPRLAAGCGKYIVKDYNPHSREYMAKALALYSRLQTKIPEGAVAAPSRSGLKEMFSRGCSCSCEGAKAADKAKRRAEDLEKQVGQLRVRTKRAEKSQGGSRQGSCLRGKCCRCRRRRRIAGALLGKSAKDPRLAFQGRVLAC
jgi:hypothetical protein